MDFKSILAIFACALVFEMPWPINMIICFFVLTKSMHKFCIIPLAQKLSANGNIPTNYMTRKIKNVREVIWVVGCLMQFEILAILEIFLIAYGAKKMGESSGPISIIRTDDGEIHEEMFFEDIDEESNQTSFLDTFSTRVSENENRNVSVTYNYNDNDKEVFEEINNEVEEEPKQEIFENETKEVDSVFEQKIKIPKTSWDLFDKPIEDIKTDFSISTSTTKTNGFDFDKPVGSVMNSGITDSIKEQIIEIKDDEIRCEKCGEVMSKNKIACPKCGELVKYKPGR